jgi:hypothetical protein
VVSACSAHVLRSTAVVCHTLLSLLRTLPVCPHVPAAATPCHLTCVLVCVHVHVCVCLCVRHSCATAS